MKTKFFLLTLVCLACGSDDSGDKPKCQSAGTWTLTESTTGGDCQAVGEVAQTSFIVSATGTAQIRDEDGGLIDCEGSVSDGCSGTFRCTAEYEVESEGETLSVTAVATYTLSFDGNATTGTLHATGSGDFSCTNDAAVIGSR